MTSQSNVTLALQLQKQLGPGSYKSAWRLPAKLRLAMVDPGRSPSKGLVGADETIFSCRREDDLVTGGGGRSAQGKLLITGAAEVGDSQLGRIKLTGIKNFSATRLHAFLADKLGKHATAKTDS